MKKILFFCVLTLFLSSCVRQKLHKKYPDCADYFSFLEKSWIKKGNGYFMIKEVPDSTKPVWAKYVEQRPQFKQRWDTNMRNCLSYLTEKEIKSLFGEPSIVKEINKEGIDSGAVLYRYYIADEFCNEENAEDFKPVRCSIIEFAFWKGKLGEKKLPRPRLILNDSNT